MVTIGIDPHKASHTAVALDEEGRLLGELRVVATKAMLERLLRWAERWPERIWAVEGASGLGHRGDPWAWDPAGARLSPKPARTM